MQCSILMMDMVHSSKTLALFLPDFMVSQITNLHFITVRIPNIPYQNTLPNICKHQ